MRKRLSEGPGGGAAPPFGTTPFGLAIGVGTGTVGDVYVSLRPERGGGGAIRGNATAAATASSGGGGGGGGGSDEGGEPVEAEDDDASFSSYKVCVRVFRNFICQNRSEISAKVQIN